MNSALTPAPLWLRFAALGAGVMILLWLPIEDTQINTVNLFALLIAALIATRAAYKYRAAQIHSFAHAAWIGLLTGTSTTPIALLLITVKTGIHSHGIPDFTPLQLKTLIQRTPYFALGGLLIALGCTVWMYNRENR